MGIIAYSLVLGGELFGKGSYSLVPDSLYKPLDQGFVMTSRAKQNPVAAEFARFMVGPQARDVMAKFGFTPPLLNRVGEVRIQTRGLEPCS